MSGDDKQVNWNKFREEFAFWFYEIVEFGWLDMLICELKRNRLK